MKTETKQPQRAHGELFVSDTTSLTNNFKTFINVNDEDCIAIVYGETQDQADKTAQRMAKAVNLHEDLVQAIKTQSEIISKILASERIVNLDESIAYYEQLVKKAEQK